VVPGLMLPMKSLLLIENFFSELSEGKPSVKKKTQKRPNSLTGIAARNWKTEKFDQVKERDYETCCRYRKVLTEKN
jgi:hypothetical protein